jgi:hypothetical protein
MNVETPCFIVQARDCGRAIRAILASVFPSQHSLPDDWNRLVRQIERGPQAA